MFEGGVPIPDQFHQFIASSASSRASSSSSSLPLPQSLHYGSSSFEPYTITPTTTAATSSQQVQHLLHQLHQAPPPPPTTKNQGSHKQDGNMVAMNLEIERERSADPWSSDEVIALLKIRSSMENWFPEFTWEHVSRKLAELGFQLRSAEKCKEKFEEESRYFNNNINYSTNKSNYSVFSEFDELYHGDHDHHPHQVGPHDQVGGPAEKNKKTEEDDNKPSDDREEDKMGQLNLEGEDDNPRTDQTVVENSSDQERSKGTGIRKRRRQKKKFEMLKGFCEDVVKKLMDQQEEMHNKILEDMVRRDEEKVAREEAWKKREMERMNKEIEVRAQEQAVAGDRQAQIINFLKNFTSTSLEDERNPSTSSSTHNPNHLESSPCLPPPNPSSSKKNASTALLDTPVQRAQNPSFSFPAQKAHAKSCSGREDVGKRWPRDEVLALINLRSSFYNSSNNEEKEGGKEKAPLWERISVGMEEIGYKRSAKRCKEKWENINKYFRKTKDVNKKRSVDSRTCPYFHQLSSLYNQGTLMAPSDHHHGQEKRSDARGGAYQNGSSSTSPLHGLELEEDKNMGEVDAGFEFEF